MYAITDSDNGLSPVLHQAITLNQYGLIVNWTFGNKLQRNFHKNTDFPLIKNGLQDGWHLVLTAMY